MQASTPPTHAAPASAAPAAVFGAFAALIPQIAPGEVSVERIVRETTLAGDLALDSISLVSLVALAEEQFGLSLSEHAERVANLRTVGEAADLIAAIADARAAVA